MIWYLKQIALVQDVLLKQLSTLSNISFNSTSNFFIHFLARAENPNNRQLLGGVGYLLGGLVESILGEPAEYPHYCSLKLDGRQICAGAIISSNHVLTAAQCVSG